MCRKSSKERMCILDSRELQKRRQMQPKTYHTKIGRPTHKRGNDVDEQRGKYESKLESIVKAVKEGFKTQNDFLSNALKETQQEQQSTPLNWEQIRKAQVYQTQLAAMEYAQNFPQFMMPAYPFPLNQSPLYNVQPDAKTMNSMGQNQANMPNI